MKKRLHILFMALLAMAVLGGCGADGTGESSEDTSSKKQSPVKQDIERIYENMHRRQRSVKNLYTAAPLL